MTRVLIVRHAESDKTLKNIHGGSGTLITERGQEDIVELTKFIESLRSEPNEHAVIYSSFVAQVRITANMLSSATNIPVGFIEGLKNIDMGVLAGLSDEDATRRYPEVMNRLRMWREGLLNVDGINIPNAEPLSQFVDRIQQVVTSALAERRGLHIFIVTRSVGIAIMNILLSKTTLLGKPYTRFRLDPCSVTMIEADVIGEGNLIFTNRTDFLKRTIDYPDD